jgi:integrase
VSALRGHVADYLRLRRALGFRLEREERLLGQFCSHLEAAGAATVISSLAIGWARQPSAAQPAQWAKRLGVIRRFAHWLSVLDPAAEIPPAGVFPARRNRPAPYLWTEGQIEDLLAGARAVRTPLLAASLEALFGLLAVSGMRIGEAVALRPGDVDLGAGVITIREAKHDRGAAPLRGRARPALPPAPVGDVLPDQHGHRHGSQRSREALPQDHHRSRDPDGHHPPPCARSQTQFRRPDHDQMGTRGKRRRRGHRAAVGLPRARQPLRHVLVPVSLP